MAKHHVLGTAGEAWAATWLQNSGFELLHCNWRHSYYEIDIIAFKAGVVHFVEVKTRRSKTFGEPEEAVDNRKLLRLMEAGEAFQFEYPQWTRVQYDVLSITLEPNGSIVYFYNDDVYL